MNTEETPIDIINELLLSVAAALITAIVIVSIVYPAYQMFLGR